VNYRHDRFFKGACPLFSSSRIPVNDSGFNASSYVGARALEEFLTPVTPLRRRWILVPRRLVIPEFCPIALALLVIDKHANVGAPSAQTAIGREQRRDVALVAIERERSEFRIAGRRMLLRSPHDLNSQPGAVALG
jgi:hypothetical protein